MKRSLLSLQILLACLVWNSVVLGQQTGLASKDKAPARPASAAPVVSQAVVVPSYKYEAKGRRDPFRSLDVVNTVQATTAPIVRPPGLKGQLVSEINLVGIVKSKGEYLAMATGYRGKTYFVRPNDELYDGKVAQIRSDAVVFSQILTDSQGRKLSQQVVKKLYPTRGEGNATK